MKRSIFILVPLLLLAGLLSCDQKKAQKEKEAMAADQSGQTNPAEKPEDKVIYQVAGFQKTACYGKCPVYQVKIFSDGSATWNGKMNVERMGQYSGRVSDQTLRAIRDKAFEVGFFDFYNEYPLKDKVTDLPSTITYIRVGDMEKTVRNIHDSPQSLLSFEAYMEGIIDGIEWMPSE